jgi:hypothetical protein
MLWLQYEFCNRGCPKRTFSISPYKSFETRGTWVSYQALSSAPWMCPPTGGQLSRTIRYSRLYSQLWKSANTTGLTWGRVIFSSSLLSRKMELKYSECIERMSLCTQNPSFFSPTKTLTISLQVVTLWRVSIFCVNKVRTHLAMSSR